MSTVLEDKEFLKQLDEERVKKTYAKIVVLTKDEYPIAEIQGRVSAGSLNVDGNSSVRRTCNITFIADDTDNDLSDIDNLFSLNKKIKVFIGEENNINDKYENIIWFKQGTFVIVNASLTHNTNSVTISLSCKDKMCLLNGELGGTFPAPVTLNTFEQVNDDGEIIEEEQKIYDIIRTIVSWYGGEDDARIIVNDVDLYTKQIVRYTGSDYLYIQTVDGQVQNVSLNRYDTTIEGQEINDTIDKTKEGLLYIDAPAAKVNEKTVVCINPYFNASSIDSTKNLYELNLKEMSLEDIPLSDGWDYYAAQDEVGYTYVDFVWASDDDLIANAGDAITSILDKIISLLGNYEYFYDIDGNFIFQEKRNFLNNRCEEAQDDRLLTAETSSQENDLCGINSSNYMADYNGNSQIVYSFEEGNSLISAYSNTIDFTSIKNDFHVWGKSSKDASSYDLHYHLVVREKPEERNTYKVIYGRNRSTGEELDTLRLFNHDKYTFCEIGKRVTTIENDTSYIYIRIRKSIKKENLIKYINTSQLYIKNSENKYESYSLSNSASWTEEESEKTLYYKVGIYNNITSLVGKMGTGKKENTLILDDSMWEIKYDNEVAWMKQPEQVEYTNIIAGEELIPVIAENGYIELPANSFIDEGSADKIITLPSAYITSDGKYIAFSETVEGNLWVLPETRSHVYQKTLYTDGTWGVEGETIKLLYGVWYKDVDDNYTSKDWRMELLLQGLSKSQDGIRPDIYEQELIDKFLDTYNPRKQCFKADMIRDPNQLKYFLDFISISGKNKYSTENIGIKTYSKLYDGVRKIFTKEVPDIVYLNSSENNSTLQTYKDLCDNNGQVYISLDEDTYNNLSVGVLGDTGIETARNLLYQYTEFTESINLQTIPIYYLEPNTRITVYDKKANVSGDYIISSLNPPLNGSGTMSIQATKAVTKF
jgi:hypothetical protein